MQKPSLPAPLLLSTLLTILALLPMLISARCCFPGDDSLCADGRSVKGWCCGWDKCNLFCCACNGGCLGSPRTTKSHGNRGLSGSDNGSNDTEFDSFEVGPSLAAGGSTQYQVCTAATGASIFSGDDDCGAQIFRSLDDEGTGKLSFSQYLRWHRGRELGGAGAGRANIGEDDCYTPALRRPGKQYKHGQGTAVTDYGPIGRSSRRGFPLSG